MGRYMRQANVKQVREVLGSHIGHKVRIRANMGRHKFDVSEGVISETYPSIFLVKVDTGAPENPYNTVSFSYTDVLTNDVVLTLCS